MTDMDQLASLDYQKSLQDQARAYADQYEEGEPGFCAPEKAAWLEYAAFPLSELGDRQAWSDYFDSECKLWAEEGQPDRFDDMVHGRIRTPVVVLKRGDDTYVWDGNHRIGAAMKAGVQSIPAIIGVAPEDFPVQTLHYAVYERDYAEVVKAIDRLREPNPVVAKQITDIFVRAHHNGLLYRHYHSEIGRLLTLAIDAGAEIAGREDLRDIQLHQDANIGPVEGKLMRLLCTMTPDQSTVPSHEQISNAMRRMVLECEANPNAKSLSGRTLLYLAIRDNNASMVRTLVELGADIDAPVVEHGNSALVTAKINNQVEIIQVLQSASAKKAIDNVLGAARVGAAP